MQKTNSHFYVTRANRDVHIRQQRRKCRWRPLENLEENINVIQNHAHFKRTMKKDRFEDRIEILFSKRILRPLAIRVPAAAEFVALYNATLNRT